jgi:hypothetical protein
LRAARQCADALAFAASCPRNAGSASDCIKIY